MTANQKVSGTAYSIPGGLAAGALVSSLITVLGAMIAAWLIGNEKLHENQIGYCSMVILLAASFLGARTAERKIKHRKLYVSVLSGIVYYCLLLAENALFFGGQYQAMGVTALLILAGSVSSALLGQREKGRGHKRRPSGKHR